MSAIPNTDSKHVAAVAAALDITRVLRIEEANKMEATYFEPTLERFLTAYRAIAKVLKLGLPED